MDVVSNENVALFWIQSLSVCRAITFLITELIMFSPALRPVGSVSIIEPEAPGVLLRYPRNMEYFSKADPANPTNPANLTNPANPD